MFVNFFEALYNFKYVILKALSRTYIKVQNIKNLKENHTLKQNILKKQ